MKPRRITMHGKSIEKILMIFIGIGFKQVFAQWILQNSYFMNPTINSADTAGWSKNAVLSCYDFDNTQALGGLNEKDNNNHGFWQSTSVTKSISNLPNHTKIKIAYTVYYLEWNGSSDDSESEEGNNQQNSNQSQSTVGLKVDNVLQSSDTFPDFSSPYSNPQQCTYSTDRVIKKYKTEITHSSSSLSLTFFDTIKSTGSSHDSCSHQGWGIRDIKVYILPCHFSCLKCSGTNDQCQTCTSNSSLISSTKYCQCSTSFYASSLTPFTCSACQNSCKECSGGQLDDCTKCKANAILLSGKCVCNTGFRMNESGDCIPCHFSCKECSNGALATQCTSCYCDGQLNTSNGAGVNMGTCECTKGFSQLAGFEFKCTKCHLSCEDCNKLNANECTECTENASLATLDSLNDSRFCKCNDRFFAIQAPSQELRCLPCSSSCKSCTSMFKCDSCFPNADLIDGTTCVCRTGFYAYTNASSNSIECRPCSGNCKSCTSALLCTACSKNAYIVSNACQCFEGYFPYIDPITNAMECQKCHPTCRKCFGPTKNDCTECEQFSDFVISAFLPPAVGSCKCKPAFYMASESPFVCQPCHPTCKTCSLSYEEDQCDTCFDNMEMICSASGNNVTPPGRCKCHAGTYFNPSKSTCETCGKFCGECNPDSPENCISCMHPDTYLLQPSEGNSSSPAICVVKPGKFENCSGDIDDCSPECAECNSFGTNNCTACKGNLQLLNGACVCASGMTNDPANPTLNCLPCANSCATCCGINSNECLTCKENYTLDEQTKECNPQSDCVVIASAGDNSSQKCIKCHMNCATCSDTTSSSCLSCKSSNQILINGRCVCNDGFYVTSNYPLQCAACDESCKNCSGSLSNQCTNCVANASLELGRCVCNSGYYLVSTPVIIETLSGITIYNQISCEKCSNSCVECTTRDSNCTKCTANAGLVNGACICKDGYTFNPTNGLCVKCNGNCRRCSYLNTNTCTACTEHAEISLNKCVCSPGYFAIPNANSLTCAACHPTCETCDLNNSSNSCLTCKNDFTFSQVTCSSSSSSGSGCPSMSEGDEGSDVVSATPRGKCKCREGLFTDPADNSKCKQCSANCKSCKGSATNCITCNSATQIIVHGVCVCPESTYQDESNSCLPCHSTCATCTGSASNQCLTCNDATFTFVAATNSCVCPNHTSLDAQTHSTCVPCSANCKTCAVGDPYECLSCFNNGVIDTATKQCVCPSGQFLDTSCENFECKPCSNHCKECFGSNANQCLTCPDNAFLTEDETCQCNPGYYNSNQSSGASSALICLKCSNSCSTCELSSTKCTSCFCNQELTSSNTCTCSSGFTSHPNSPRCCIRCDSTCASCSGPNSTDCASCKTNATLQPISNNCVCNDGYFLQNYPPYECSTCHKKCSTCFGNLSTQCLTCKTNAILVNNECLCKYGYFYNTSTQICETCSSPCASCVDSPTKCIDCYDNATLSLNSQCTCNNGYIYSNSIENSSNPCIPCSDNCKTCGNNLPTSCTTCITHASLNPSTKQCSCDAGYFAPANAPFSCQPCDDNCKTCQTLSTNCTSCDDSLATIDAISHSCVCPSGYYASKFSRDLKCYPCDDSCKECKGPTAYSCTACNANATLNWKNECDCNDGYYYNFSTKQCAACNSNCATCVFSSTKCTSCKAKSMLTLSLNCVCLPGYFDATGDPDFRCDTCSNTCKTCTTSLTTCVTCKDNATLNSTTKQCICNEGYYQDATSGDCKACATSCKRCNNSNSSNKCTECYDNSELQSDGTCACKPHYFVSKISPRLTCTSCDNNCNSCSNSASSCDSCCEDAHIVTASASSKKCVCDDGYYQSSSSSALLVCSPCNSNCKTCSTSATTCVTCTTNATLNTNTKVCECKSGYYFSNAGTCIPCNGDCKTCANAADKCTSCATGFTFDSAAQKCKCNAGTYYDFSKPGTCQKCDKSCAECTGGTDHSCSTCGSNEHLNSATNECLCDDGFYENYSATGAFCLPCMNTCKTCENNNKCLTCKPNATFSSSTKLCTCNEGYFLNSLTGNCDACNGSCKSCSNPSASGCSACRGHAKLKNGICTCDAGYFMNTNAANGQYTCDACHNSCVTCTGPLDTDCTSCNENASTPAGGKGACVCCDGYYVNPANYKCFECHDDCNTCSGPNQNKCLSCRPHASVVNGFCVCDNGYYLKNGNCVSCHETCAKCTSNNNSNNCSACKDNATLQSNGTCLCNSGFYFANGACVSCNSNCATCSSSATNCLSCRANQHKVQNGSEYKCVCDTHYYVSSTSPAFTCSACHATCKECTNATAAGCSPCVDHAGYNMTPSGQSTVCICDKGYYAVPNSASSGLLVCTKCTLNNCVDCASATACNECAQYYTKQADGSCKVQDGMCDDPPNGPQNCHATCRKCFKVGAQGCTACYDNASVNSSNECACVYGYFRDSPTGICKPCHATCETCSGGLSTNCLTCKSHATKTGNTCVCDAGYFFDGVNCTKCNSTCATCTDSASKCLTCKSHADFHPDNNTCTCSTGYFWNSTSLNCEKCNESCEKCTDNANKCTSCRSDSTFNATANTCICKDGTYRDASCGETCKPCSNTCKTCNFPNICLTCIEHTHKSPGTDLCVPDPHHCCDPSTNTCNPCHGRCSECYTPSSNDCKECYPNSHLVTTTSPAGLPLRACECDDYYYYASSTATTCSPCAGGCKTCTGPNPNQCTSCKSPLASVNPSTSQCECPSTHFMDPITFDCTPCNKTCLTCSAAQETNCITCPPNSTFDPNTSTCPCNAHFFRDSSSSTCKPCHGTCSSCCNSDSSSCTACYAGADLINSKCICKSNYFFDTNTNTCIKCLAECSTCTQSATTCTSCVDPNATVSPQTSLCVCKQNYFFSSYTQTCVICSKTCKTCSGCNDNECTSCYENATLNPSTNTCTCNAGYYKDPINSSNCLACNPTCNTCLDAATTCSSCRSNATLISNACICNDGYFYNTSTNNCEPCYSNCRHCTSPSNTQCIDCYNQQIIFSPSDSRCVCGAGFFQDPQNNRNCIPCHASCATCTGSTNSQCITCTGANMIAVNGICKCKPTYYLSTSNGQCVKCADRCTTCTSSSTNNCTACITNASLQLVSIYTPNILTCQCNENFYYNASTQTCDACHVSCSKCNGPLASDCTVCSSVTVLSNKLCICKQGYYSDLNDSGRCKPCHAQCVNCSGPNINQCTSCSGNAHLSQTNTCDCSDGYYRDATFPAICNPCHSDCKSCLDSTAISCTSCRSDSTYNMNFFPSIANAAVGTCGCLDGYQYMTCDCLLRNYCRACASTCKTCSGTSNLNCLTCYANATRLANGSCKCSAGFYLASDGRTCSQCSQSCVTCGGPSSSECLSCTENATLSNGVCTCKSGYYASTASNGSITCLVCPENCTQCTSQSVCTQCKAGFSINPSNSQCTVCAGLFEFTPKQAESLMKSAVASIQSHLLPCHATCFTCSGPHQNECTSCVDSAILNKKRNTCECRTGFFFNKLKSQCMPCANACEKCESDHPSACLTCIPNAAKNSRQNAYHNNNSNAIIENTQRIGERDVCMCNEGYKFDSNTNSCIPIDRIPSEICSIALKNYLDTSRILASTLQSKRIPSTGDQQQQQMILTRSAEYERSSSKQTPSKKQLGEQQIIEVELTLDFMHSLIPADCDRFIDFIVQTRTVKHTQHNNNIESHWTTVKQRYISNKGSTTPFSKIMRLPRDSIEQTELNVNNELQFRVAAIFKNPSKFENNSEESMNILVDSDNDIFKNAFTLYYDSTTAGAVIVNGFEQSLFNSTKLTEQLAEEINSQKILEEEIVNEQLGEVIEETSSRVAAARCDIRSDVMSADCFVITDVDVESYVCADITCENQRKSLAFVHGEKMYVAIKFIDSSATKILRKKVATLLVRSTNTPSIEEGSINTIPQQLTSTNAIIDVTKYVTTLFETTQHTIFEVDFTNCIENYQQVQSSYFLQITAEIIEKPLEFNSNFESITNTVVKYFAGANQESVTTDENRLAQNVTIADISGITFVTETEIDPQFNRVEKKQQPVQKNAKIGGSVTQFGFLAFLIILAQL